jgi:hypothetical protein
MLQTVGVCVALATWLNTMAMLTMEMRHTIRVFYEDTFYIRDHEYAMVEQ